MDNECTVLLSDSILEIQKKLSSNKVVKFQKGTYKITKQLIIQSDSVIDLNGAKLLRYGDIQSVFLGYVTKKTTVYNGCHDVTIKNGTIENMGQFSADNLITFVHSKNVIIENVSFVDCSMHAIEINSSLNATIRKCKFLGHYSKSKGDNYKESIQYDSCCYSAFVLKGTKPNDRMYDGTCCKNLVIEDCEFDGGYRGYHNVCIGQHCQVYGKYHENFTIRNNKMVGNVSNKTAIAIKLIGVINAVVENNSADYFARFVYIFNNGEYSYNPKGVKVKPRNNDGLCDNVTIKNNEINHPLSTYSANCIFATSKTNSNHTRIVKENNTVTK